MADISLGFASKSPPEGLKEEEIEHNACRATARQAKMEADARHKAARSDNAHCGATNEGLEELDELLQDPLVAHEEN